MDLPSQTDHSNGSIIEFTRVGYRIEGPDGSIPILDGLDLSVQAADSIAVTGPSGAGKSTLLSLIAGLIKPSEGVISVCNQSLNELDEEGLAALRATRLGFIFQGFLLIPELTAIENILLPARMCGHTLTQEKAHHYLNEVGLQNRANHYPHQLSGGEQQRLAIARAFSGEPSVLLADEPTGNLDPDNSDRIAELLFNLNRQHGTTLALVTHDIGLARRCARTYRLANRKLEILP